jgi:hypothetical protein
LCQPTLADSFIKGSSDIKLIKRGDRFQLHLKSAVSLFPFSLVTFLVEFFSVKISLVLVCLVGAAFAASDDRRSGEHGGGTLLLIAFKALTSLAKMAASPD